MVAHPLIVALREIRSAAIAQMPEAVAIRLQLLQLLLRKVADAQIGGGHASARERRRFARQHPGQGGFAAAVRPQQCYSILRTDRGVDAAHDPGIAIAAGGVLDRQQRARRLERRGKLELERAVDMRGNDALHALQHLDPALGLPRFCGAGPKTVYERGDFRHTLQLPRLQRLLQRQFLGALLLELRVVARIGVDGAIFDMQHPVDDGIEKLTIMRNHQQGAGECGEPILEPDDGVQIQVIGRFIEQQQIGPRTQCARHSQTHAPAAGEFRDLARVIRRLETEPVHDRRCPRPRAIAVNALIRGMGFGELHGGVARFSVGNRGEHFAQFQIAIQHEFNRGTRT